MILVDSSAWIEFLRGTDSPVCQRLEDVLGHDLAVCGPIRMEILAGARDEVHLAELRALLARATILPMAPHHYEMAATLFRQARASGRTVRRLLDCLIAAVAIDHGVAVLQADRDFVALAEVSPLELDHGSSPPDRSRGD